MQPYRYAAILLAELVVLGAICGDSQATPPPAGLTRNSLSIRSSTNRYRPQRPTFSPYIALSPGSLGNLAGVNYFAVVRPELNQRQINQQQNVELRTIENQVRAIEAEETETKPEGPPTIGFQTQRKYFGAPLNQSAVPPGTPRTNEPRILSTTPTVRASGRAIN